MAAADDRRMAAADDRRMAAAHDRRRHPPGDRSGPALAAGTSSGSASGESGQASVSFDGTLCGMATERAGTTVEIACL